MNEKFQNKIEKFLKQETFLVTPHSWVKDSHISNEEFENLLGRINLCADDFGSVIYMYLDVNEYSGFNLSEQKIKKQKEILNSDDFFKSIKIHKYSHHKKLSLPVFISWKKIEDVPSYIDEIALYSGTSLQNLENLEKFMQQNNNSIFLYNKALCKKQKSKNIIYENKDNGKSKWMKDVKKGKLFLKNSQ